MVRLSIELPEELKARVETRAAQAGHASVEAYVQVLLQEDVDSGPPGAPASQTFGSEAELLEMIRAGAESGPALELTEADWERKRQQLAERHRRAGRE